MSIERKRIDAIRQGSLFLVRDRGKIASINRATAIPGSLNLDSQIRELVSEGLKRSPLSRHQIAAEMSTVMGKEVTKTTLDTFSAESKGNHRLPACYVAAFGVATGDTTIISAICEAVGGAFLPDVETLTLELHKIQGEKRELKEREQIIKELMTVLQETRR